MSEEIKTNAEALDEAMTGNMPDDVIGEIPTTGDIMETPETLDVYLCNGTTLSINYDEMNWTNIWNDAREDLINNALASTSMLHKMAIETDESASEEMAKSSIETITQFFESVGVPRINYEMRENIPITEKAMLMLYDSYVLISNILRTAEVEVLTAPTDGMTLDQMIQNMADLATGKKNKETETE